MIYIYIYIDLLMYPSIYVFIYLFIFTIHMIFPWILLKSSEDFSFLFSVQPFEAQIEEANAQDKADAEAMVQNHQPGDGMKSYPVIQGVFHKGQCKDPYG